MKDFHLKEESKILKENKKLLLLLLCVCLLNVFQPYLFVWIPKVIADHLNAVQELTGYLFLIGGALILLQGLLSFCNSRKDHEYAALRFRLFRLIDHKALTMSYEHLVSQNFQDNFKFCIAFVDDTEKGLQAAVEHVFLLFTNAGLFLLYLLTMTFIDFKIPLFIIILTVIDFIGVLRAHGYESRQMDKMKRLDNQAKTLEMGARRAEQAKDIKIYGAGPFFLELYKGIIRQKTELAGKVQRRYGGAGLTGSVLSVIRDCVCYFYLIYQLSVSAITIGDFVLLIAAVTGFSENLAKVFKNLAVLARDKISFAELQKFLSDTETTDEIRSSSTLFSKPFREIRFEHVSFRYGESEKYALRDINFTIKSGEQIGLVGLNGAGKTTITLLLCGLLRPTKGTIYVNDMDINMFPHEEYLNLYSVVFQDVCLLRFSIQENVTGRNNEMDDEKLFEILKRVGLEALIGRVGVKRMIEKTFDETGIDLSGGEKQKLSIARALYKDAEVFLLDEPLAAFDPLAEEHFLKDYKKVFDGKTTVFISHRLVNTRLCDRILLMNEGRLVEMGTHEDLMGQRGLYYELYTAQKESYGL